MTKTLLSLFLISSLTLTVNAQVPFSAIDSVDINKINASVMLHGDLWWYSTPSTYEAKSFFPKGTDKSFGGFGNAVWMSGYDAGGQLHIAAATYRQDGNDYWPGPLDNSDTITYATSHDWAKIWKINKTDIDAFRALGTHTISNTHATILSWPAKGNPYAAGNLNIPLTITEHMAPFVDVNGDGTYNPLAGDYPAIKGDQALWWTFSDNGPNHGQSKGRPLKVQVHAMAYAYSRGTLIDNVIYYDYEVVNKSDKDYHDFRFAFRADMDLGHYLDDYVGFDSVHRLAIQYNATADDGGGAGHPKGSYGLAPPVAGIAFLSLPGDGAGTYVPAGSFTYHNNDPSVVGVPSVDTQYNNYMRARIKAGYHVTNDFAGAGTASIGYGSGPLSNYVFTGDPSDNTQWSECAAGNMSGDRQFVLASNDVSLPAGGSQRFVLALLISDTANTNHCGALSFTGIKTVADTAWNYYNNPPTNSVTDAAMSAASVYPNPAGKYLHIGTNYDRSEQITVLDPAGRTLNVPVRRTATEAILDLGNLTPGVYLLRYVNNTVQQTATFTKY